MHIKFLLAIFAQFITIIVVIIELNPNSLFWYLESLMIFNNFLSHISFYIFPQITLISHTSLINVLEILGFTLGNPFFFSSVYFLPAILQLSKFHRLFEAQPLWDLPSDQWKSSAGTHCYHHTAYSMTVYILIYQRSVMHACGVLGAELGRCKATDAH